MSAICIQRRITGNVFIQRLQTIFILFTLFYVFNVFKILLNVLILVISLGKMRARCSIVGLGLRVRAGNTRPVTQPTASKSISFDRRSL